MAWSVVASGVAASLGAAATGYALLVPIDGGTQAWIDSPTAGAALSAGHVTVTAHATDGDEIGGMSLRVDGKPVAEDKRLDRSGLLVFASFDWTATPGTHTLRVVQAGGSGTTSDDLMVTVLDPDAPTPEPATTPRATPSTTATPTPAASASPSATRSADPTRAAPPAPAPTKTTRTPKPLPPKPAPAPAPVIDSAAFTGPWASDPRLYTFSSCPYMVRIEAHIQNATQASVAVSGVGSFPMSASGSTWDKTLASGFDAGQVGSHTVSVTATGPGGTTSKTVGTLTILPACPKD